jgi:hypothetical protein
MIAFVSILVVLDLKQRGRSTEATRETSGNNAKPARNGHRHQVFMTKLDDASATRSLPLTTIAKPMNRFAVCGDPRAERDPGIER